MLINWHAHALCDLGDICVLAGRRNEGIGHLGDALALYERKGNLVSAARVRSALDELRASGQLVSQRTTH